MDTYVLVWPIPNYKKLLYQTIPRLLVASLCHLIMCSVTGIVSMLLIRQMIIATGDLKANKIPTDVMILDMDWHWNEIT